MPKVLPTGKPGALIASSKSRVAGDLLAGATRTEFIYHSADRTGADVPVSATVLVPAGRAPTGGWPIVAWAHGTTGVADKCAPSTTDNLFYNEYAQVSRAFLRYGYAVVATDYMGLGTPGDHSYSVGVDLGNAVADSVPAARSVVRELSPNWFAVGHSEGGQAVLFATRSAARLNSDFPELRLRGTVAIAPSSNLGLALPAITAGGLPADVVYGLYLLVGLRTVDPKIDIEALIGPAGREQLKLITSEGCLLDGLAALSKVDATHIFAIPADTMAELSDLLASVGNPDASPTVGPLLVVQGEDDHDIPAGITAKMVESLTSQGVDVKERVYPGLDHDRVLGPALCDILTWMTEHGGTATTDCVSEPTDMS